jgi:transcriptional regulator with XRE-family HTH domain
MEPQKAREYWPSLIMAIRHAQQWSQSTFASEVDSSQETVSRWESGAVIPSRQKQNRIEQIAEGANISSLGGISNIVRLSPYSMLLCDGNDLVIAASESSGFQEGRTALSQTPEFQHAYFEQFSMDLKSSGFWAESGRSHQYSFSSPAHGEFRAVLVSIKIQGAIYCVVQAIPPSSQD